MGERGFWVKKHLQINTDDIGVMLSANTGDENNSTSHYCLVDPVYRGQSNVRSYHCSQNNESSKFQQAMTVVLTVSADASGGTAPAYLTFKNLSESEMPTDEVVAVELAGLAIGSSTDNRNDLCGYVLFARSGNQEQARFKDYRTNVFYPYIERCRQRAFPEWRPGQEITPQMRAVSFIDGHVVQLKVMTSEEILSREADLGIVTGKSAGGFTGMVQVEKYQTLTKMITRACMRSCALCLRRLSSGRSRRR